MVVAHRVLLWKRPAEQIASSSFLTGLNDLSLGSLIL